jgi:mono/diheme cytochrome c family protein
MLRKKITSKVVITFIITISCFLQLSAENNWNVPADKKAKNSYIKFDAASAQTGEAIYIKNCQSCHGNPGKGNSLKSLKPIPPDLSSVSSQALTDGELFYILSTGRMIMPSFKNVLSEDERWRVISFLRSYNKNYVQVLSKFDPTKSKLVKIELNFDSKTNTFHIDVKANEKTGIISLKDAEVGLFASRYFGRLQIDKTQRTNSEGSAAFVFPKNLPGDKLGNIELIVKVSDENYGEIELAKKFKVGIPTDKPSLTQDRAIWNVLVKAPVWIILLYTSGVLAFGFVLLYLLNNLRQLKKIGEN